MDDNMLYGISLKKCPWCGSPGKMYTAVFDRPVVDAYGHEYFKYYVECTNPECNAKAPHPYANDIFRSKEAAVMMACKIWNTRVG